MSQEKQKPKQVSVLLLGSERSGKTAFVHFLAGKRFDEQYKPTKKVNTTLISSNNQNINFNFIDFPSKDISAGIPDKHSKEADFIFLIIDVSQSLDKIQSDLELLLSKINRINNNDKCNILVIGSKLDMIQPEELNQKTEKIKEIFANIGFEGAKQNQYKGDQLLSFKENIIDRNLIIEYITDLSGEEERKISDLDGENMVIDEADSHDQNSQSKFFTKSKTKANYFQPVVEDSPFANEINILVSEINSYAPKQNISRKMLKAIVLEELHRAYITRSNNIQDSAASINLSTCIENSLGRNQRYMPRALINLIKKVESYTKQEGIITKFYVSKLIGISDSNTNMVIGVNNSINKTKTVNYFKELLGSSYAKLHAELIKEIFSPWPVPNKERKFLKAAVLMELHDILKNKEDNSAGNEQTKVLDLAIEKVIKNREVLPSKVQRLLDAKKGNIKMEEYVKTLVLAGNNSRTYKLLFKEGHIEEKRHNEKNEQSHTVSCLPFKIGGRNP